MRAGCSHGLNNPFPAPDADRSPQAVWPQTSLAPPQEGGTLKKSWYRWLVGCGTFDPLLMGPFPRPSWTPLSMGTPRWATSKHATYMNAIFSLQVIALPNCLRRRRMSEGFTSHTETPNSPNCWPTALPGTGSPSW